MPTAFTGPQVPQVILLHLTVAASLAVTERRQYAIGVNREVLTPELIEGSVGRTRVLREYRVFPEIGSTNTYLREEARDEAEGLVVVAEYQTAGRGRQGRSWVAPAGSSIHCSVLLRPALPTRDLYLLTAACALALRDAIAPLVTRPPVLKWPNDVLMDGRKVCGILAETGLPREGIPRIVLGFGVNVHTAPGPDVAPAATSVAEYATGTVTRLQILARALRGYDALLHRLYRGEADAVWREWRRGLRPLGRWVQVRGPNGTQEGRALDVARDGGLILETQPGAAPQTVYAGEAIEQV